MRQIAQKQREEAEKAAATALLKREGMI